MEKILVSEKIAQKGIDDLVTAGYEVNFQPKIGREELLEIIGDYDALIVRSATKVNEELYERAVKLKVVGRAGNGVDNIEMAGANKRGIIIVNTPDASTVTTAEHTISLMLSSNRRIPQADAMIRRREWDRTKFKGSELMGKTLGIIGVGRIGSTVAIRMRAFGMKVIGYDPYITDERFQRFQVEKRETLADLMRECDFLTIHTPKTQETFDMVSYEQFAIAKDGLQVVNCARGGLINEQALYEALESGKVAAAAIDVLADEPQLTSPLLKSDKVVFTPHLGADTFEAQENVGIAVANEVNKVLAGGVVANAVNMPDVAPSEMEMIYDYLTLGETLGKLYYGLCKAPIESVRITFSGDAAHQSTETISLAVLKGLFEPVLADRVTYVNASLIAEEEGVGVALVIKEEDARFRNRIKVNVFNKNGKYTFAGVVADKGDIRITRIERYYFDLRPAANLLVVKNLDEPGMIGHIGSVLGKLDVNISSMQCWPNEDTAMVILTIDRALKEEELAPFYEVKGIKEVHFVGL